MHETNTRTLAVFRERLKRLPVANHPALFFNPWVQGYRDYAFGGRAGPSVQASSMFHELAHGAQFGPEKFRTRATADGSFHFKVPRRYIYNRYCTMPKTNGATRRELQTFAYQLHLMRLAGYKVNDAAFVAYSAKLMQYMHDWYHVPGEGDAGRAAFCAEVLQEYYAQVTAGEVVDRLEAWLDATAKRLKRQKQAYPQAWTTVRGLCRYRVDGSVWAT